MKIQKYISISLLKNVFSQEPTQDPGELKEIFEDIKMGRIHDAAMEDFNLHSGPRLMLNNL